MGNLYMIAIMPPEELEQRIQKERIEFSENYNCVKALKPPVHITMYDPFETEDEFEACASGLQKWADRQRSFDVKLDNYGFFENPEKPVFFIKVVKDENIAGLRTELLREMKKYVEAAGDELLVNGKLVPKSKPMPFNPHITLGYRDLSPNLVPTIKQDYARRRMQATFLCYALYLWKHDGKNWRVVNTFKLNGQEEQLSLF